MAFTYPTVRRSEQVDDYHGRSVADPYRWLEDPDSEETRAFVAAQNQVTMPYLRDLPDRPELHRRMTELWDVPRTGTPTVRSGVAIWTHNDGLQDQAVFFIDRSVGPGPGAIDIAGGEVFLDPNSMSADGAVAVVVTSLSPDGRHFAYTVSEAGSDRQRLRIRSTETGEDLEDELLHLRFTSVAWYGNGFFYNRWPEADPASTEPVRDPTVHYHRIGDDQAEDRLVFHNDEDPEPSYAPIVSHDDRYLILAEHVGTSHHNGLLYRDLASLDLSPDTAATGPSRSSADGQETSRFGFTRLAEPLVGLHSFLLHHDGAFLLHTDRDAPMGAIVSMALDQPDRTTTLVAETDAAIEGAAAVAGQLLLLRLVDASHRLDRHAPDGRAIGDLALPGLGSISALSGRFEDAEVYLGYESFVEPPAVLSWSADASGAEPGGKQSRVDGRVDSRVDSRVDGGVATIAASTPPIDPGRIVVERRRTTSSDGRTVGMFVLRLADTSLPGPVEMYGYGGFSINMTPVYSPARLAFLEAGGIVAVTNLRGGTEHGEEWHEQGMFGSKQQVFDDFIACGEALVADGITTASGLGIRGGSNGGLLTAATMIQRPDLFGAVVSQVPVTDMLRYHRFTAGRYWVAEWGSADDPEAFDWLLDYSPLHNVGDAALYPPLLITTAESDDRVVPMHAHKLAAEIQHRAGGRSDGPLLLRVETRAGHGLGKPTSKVIDEAADIYAFLLHHLRDATDAG